MPARRKSGRARRTFSAGGVVYRLTTRGPEVALIKADGRWSLPKGGIEKGEKPEATALREIAEETGLPLNQLRLIRRLPDVSYAFGWHGTVVFKTVTNYLVELSGDAALAPQLSEIEDVRWFRPDVARRTISFRNWGTTLDAALASLSGLEQAS
ncbi:MAG TPA: NUDIX domain-containing protein [Candidatus Acidoferrum sp.]|nr:NUDIX domain-containing protein [Candidatus Acidoferrum sp.]